jgi:hypothetical protein
MYARRGNACLGYTVGDRYKGCRVDNPVAYAHRRRVGDRKCKARDVGPTPEWIANVAGSAATSLVRARKYGVFIAMLADRRHGCPSAGTAGDGLLTTRSPATRCAPHRHRDITVASAHLV